MSDLPQKTYPEDFKKSSAKLALDSDKPKSQVAKELGIKKSTLYTWIDKYYPEAKSKENLSKEEDLLLENKRLRKELLRAQQERDILKKATAYFANEIL